MFQSTVAPSADWALAVATQEATDKDSDVVHGKTAGNGYRLRDRRMGVARIAPS